MVSGRRNLGHGRRSDSGTRNRILPGVILMREGTGLRLVGLYNGNSYHASLPEGWESRDGPKWTRVVPKPPNEETRPEEKWAQIAPIFSLARRLTGADAANGWLAADAVGLAMYRGGKFIRLSGIGEDRRPAPPLGIKLDARRGWWSSNKPRAPARSRSAEPAGRSGVDRDRRTTAISRPKNRRSTAASKCLPRSTGPVAPSDDLAIVYCGREDDDTTVIATWRPLTGREPAGEEIPSRARRISMLSTARPASSITRSSPRGARRDRRRGLSSRTGAGHRRPARGVWRTPGSFSGPSTPFR